MKKILLGTTALAAAGLLAMPIPKASAANKPLSVSVGGIFGAFLTGISQKTGVGYPGNGTTNREVWDRSILNVRALGKFDNGISAGIRVDINGNDPSPWQTNGGVSNGGFLQSADLIGQAFTFLNLAQYGRLELGSTAGAARKMWYGANTPLRPWHGFNSPMNPQIGGNNPLNQPTTLMDMGNVDRAEKITYFTPRVAGFQLGVSYAPNNCHLNEGGFNGADQNNLSYGNGNNVAGSGACLFFGNFPSKTLVGEQNDIIEVGLNYVGKFDGVDLGAYGGMGHASITSIRQSANNSFRDLEEYGAGANVGFQGFQLGASFRFSNQGNKFGASTAAGAAGDQSEILGVAPTNRWDFNVGLTYATGPWAVGGSYGYAQDTEKCGVANAYGTCAVGGSVGKDKLNDFALGANYAIGPGVNVNGGIEYVKYDSFGSLAGATNRGWIYTIGTAMFF